MNYIQLLQDRDNFKKSAGYQSQDFNILDLPSHQYFKILFHFDNGDADYGSAHSGLLALPDSDIPLIDPTNGQWISDKNKSNWKWESNVDYDSFKDRLREQSSAWSYLVENGEDERARLLLIFINLLLNITINSPWYFLKISGLDTALERKSTMDGMKIEEERLKITLTCLPDAIDLRIGTLLDLYRSIVFSWQLKKEIVPANLRKFDMSIYIFEAPYTEQIVKSGKDMWNQASPTISYKYIELHNCEIDYGSSKSVYSELNNIEGMNPEYNIDIFFDDIYESRYNQWCMVPMGDLLKSDYNNKLYSPGPIELSAEILLRAINEQILNYWPIEPKKDDKDSTKKKKLTGIDKFLQGAKDQLIGLGKSIITGLIERVYLGNLFTGSISNIKDQANSFAQGNILNTVRNVTNVVRAFDDNASRTGNSGNLYTELSLETPNKEQIKKLGNLFKTKSIKNNI